MLHGVSEMSHRTVIRQKEERVPPIYDTRSIIRTLFFLLSEFWVDIEDYLPRPEFLRTHRSYIVHMSKAEAIERFRIVFGDQYLPISDSYKEDVQQYFDSHTLS